MATPTADTYTTAAGVRAIKGGRTAGATGPRFASVALTATDSATPYTTAGQMLSVELHGSGGGQQSGQGNTYTATLTGGLEYSTYTQFRWCEVRTGVLAVTAVRPFDNQGARPDTSRRESYWMGWTDGPDVGALRLYTERALDKMLEVVDQHMPNLSATKRYLSGGSMGAWGTMTYGVRRASKFAALYPDRPRWRYNSTAGHIGVVSWASQSTDYLVGSSPAKVADDGGGTAAQHMDLIAYVGNTANAVVPWIGWCVGRNDGYTVFSDHVAAVAALRSAKRGFAFAWNDGNHSTGSIMSQITSSYPMGLFEIGRGYPLFTNHSGDQDPAVDTVGGINLGLTFRNVVETASGWSCEVTSLLGARTVTVEPKSQVFTATVTPQNITIPAANSWVAVTFTA